MYRRVELPYLTVTGMAKRLRITPEAVLMLIKKGDLPSLVQVGNRKMFDRDEIEAWARRRNV